MPYHRRCHITDINRFSKIILNHITPKGMWVLRSLFRGITFSVANGLNLPLFWGAHETNNGGMGIINLYNLISFTSMNIIYFFIQTMFYNEGYKKLMIQTQKFYHPFPTIKRNYKIGFQKPINFLISYYR